MEKRKFALGLVISIVLIGIMGLVAGLTGKTEIIFPETAALLTGSFLVNKRPWNVPHGIWTLEMSLCALAGILISRYVELPLYFKILIAVAAVIILLAAGRTGMTPTVSACALPVLIGTTDWIYVIAVIVISAVCDAGSAIAERAGLTEPRTYVREGRPLTHWLLLYVLFAAVLTVAVATGLKFMAAPPLIVAYIGLCGPGALQIHRPVRTVILFTGTALAGALCCLLSIHTAVPVSVCLMLAAAGAWAICTALHRFFPPAAAIAILPFILPTDVLLIYSPSVCAGIALLYLAAWICQRLYGKKNVRAER